MNRRVRPPRIARPRMPGLLPWGIVRQLHRFLTGLRSYGRAVGGRCTAANFRLPSWAESSSEHIATFRASSPRDEIDQLRKKCFWGRLQDLTVCETKNTDSLLMEKNFISPFVFDAVERTVVLGAIHLDGDLRIMNEGVKNEVDFGRERNAYLTTNPKTSRHDKGVQGLCKELLAGGFRSKMGISVGLDSLSRIAIDPAEQRTLYGPFTGPRLAALLRD